MRMDEAMAIISKADGFMVSFEWSEQGLLRSDHFPDKHAGEPLIPTEQEAWDLASKFAAKTAGRAVNIYVTDANFMPVAGYESKKIVNR